MADLISIKEKLSGDLPLYISNKLIEAHFSLPLAEQRIIYAYISKLSEEHLDFPELEISAKEFADMLNLVDPNYKEVKYHVGKLMDRRLEIETEEEYTTFHWFSIARYRKKEGRLRLRIHDELKPYLLQLKREFTRLLTKQVMQFRSVYSIRIYMLCKQYQHIGKRKIPLDELKKKLGIEPGEYTLYSNFKKRVIEQAQKEINELSDIEIEFEEIKTVRKVTEIILIMSTNTKNQISRDGVHSMQLKSMAELAGILIKEIKKRTGQEMHLETIQRYSKEAIIELICDLMRGAYDNKAPNINNVNLWFIPALDDYEKRTRKYT